MCTYIYIHTHMYIYIHIKITKPGHTKNSKVEEEK